MTFERLYKNIIKGSFWNFFSKIITSSLSFLKIIIIARILSPLDFGLLWIAILTINFIDTFSHIGLKQSLIQNREDIKTYLNTAWTISILRGFLLYILIFFLAPLIGLFFEEPNACLIIRVIGLTLIFQGFKNVGVVFFEKELKFHRKIILDISYELPAFIISISLVFYFRNLWAWVFGTLIGSILVCITSYFIHPYKPKFEIKRGKAFKMFNFGKWLLINNIIIYFLIQGDELYIGKFFGATALGFYTLAYKISNLITTEITHVITSVAFPSFSIVQNNKQQLKNLYIEFVQLTSFFIFPISGLIFTLAENFTYSILGIKWAPIIPLIMILIFEAILRSIGSTLGSLSLGIGQPNIITKTALIQLLIFIVLIYPISLIFNIIGVAIVVLLHHLITTPIMLKLCFSKINLNLRVWISSISFPLLSTILMSLIIFLLQIFFESSLFSLLFLILIGISIYLIFGFVCIKVNILQSRRILQSLKQIRSNLFKLN